MPSDYHRGAARLAHAERAGLVKAFIADFWRERGHAPSMDEIGEAIGLRSKSSVHRVITRMIEEGDLTAVPGVHRTIRIREATMPARGETM